MPALPGASRSASRRAIGHDRTAAQPFGLSAPSAASDLHTEDDVHDALHLAEPRRIERVGHLDHSIPRPVDLEGEPCGSELDEAEPEVASEGVGSCVSM